VKFAKEAYYRNTNCFQDATTSGQKASSGKAKDEQSNA